MADDEPQLIAADTIEQKILVIRGQKVMLDADLAELYGVETKSLNRAVKRNLKRFPADFMFQLTHEEVSRLRYQSGTSKNKGRGGRRYLPYVFTEHGVAMLSSVLGSDRAVEINISIMRCFSLYRRSVITKEVLERELTRVIDVLTDHDEKIKALFLLVDELSLPPVRGDDYSSHKVGFFRDE